MTDSREAFEPKYTEAELVEAIEVIIKRMCEVTRRLAQIDYKDEDLNKHSNIIAMDTMRTLIEMGVVNVKEG